MKKLSLLALAAMTLTPATSFAESWQKVVTNASEFKTALNAVGAGAAGETYEILCDWDASEIVAVGKQKPKITKGRLIIRSNQTDFEKMPQLEIAFENSANGAKDELKNMKSIIFENMNLKGTGSYLIDDRKAMFADTIALRRCNIHGQARSILRFDGDRGVAYDKDTEDKEGIAAETPTMLIDVIEVKECFIHGTAQNSKDNWSVFRTFMPVNTIDIHDNMFYDMPYTKSLWETRYPGDVAATVNFSNNFVLLGENKAIATSGFTALNPGENLAAGTTVTLANNFFAGPEEGTTILKNDTSFYTNTKIISVNGGIVMTYNNVIDEKTYKPLADLTTELFDLNTTVISEGDKTLADYPEFTWGTGNVFQEASKNMYYILNSNPWKTAGYDYVNEGGTYYVGPSIAYIEKFPTPAAVNVTVNGPKYITYTITPEKDQYYLGDVVTITLEDHNSNYRKFNTFNGWSDGITETSRTETLTGDLDLTATYTNDESVVSAFDFSKVVKNQDMASYDADIYLNMDAQFQAVVKGIVCDTATSMTAPVPYIYGNFQTRPAKFGEDDPEMQMAILSRRTAAEVKSIQHDYAQVEFSTKGLKGITFSCYVGTDNNAAKTQVLEFSTDSVTWERFASVEIENGVWSELKGTLPAKAEELDKVYVRILGDISTGDIVYTLDPNGGLVDGNGELDQAAFAATDCFEYVGNILISSSTIDGISDMTTDKQTQSIDTPVYNMMGMQVGKNAKGLLIKNGKKVLVK